MFKIWIFFLTGILLLTSCQKEDSPYIKVDPLNTVIEVSSGDVYTFGIEVKSDVAIGNFKIYLKPENQFSILVMDTLINRSSFYMDWDYLIPELTDTLIKCSLIFKADDANGNHLESLRFLYVSGRGELIETSGHEITSALSENSSGFDGFSFATNTTVHSFEADSSIIHIKDATDSTFIGSELLSNKWVSPAKSLFVRFEDFDYANATRFDLINAFEAGLPSGFIDYLKPKDIILLKYNEGGISKYAAIKITNIIDEAGVDNDRYIFNVKQ